MSKVALDEARMFLETFVGSRSGLFGISLANAWSATGLLEAQKENNMLLQAQNEILTRIANYLKLITSIEAGKEGLRIPEETR